MQGDTSVGIAALHGRGDPETAEKEKDEVVGIVGCHAPHIGHAEQGEEDDRQQGSHGDRQCLRHPENRHHGGDGRNTACSGRHRLFRDEQLDQQKEGRAGEEPEAANRHVSPSIT